MTTRVGHPAEPALVHALRTRWRQFAERALRWSILLGTLPAFAACQREPLRNLHDHMSFLAPQGPIAADERFHFWMVVGVLVVFVALPVFVLTPWIVWRYRLGNQKKRSYTPKWAENPILLILTWAGPIAIVIALGYLLRSNSFKLDPYKPVASSHTALPVQVIGYDWKWLFIYPDQGIATVGVMPIPAGRPVSLQLTSATVMQSLQIPALVGQIYAMGGMVTQLNFEAWKPGRSLGMNTMYSGNGFHQQRFTTVAMPPAKFRAWVRRVKAGGLPLDAHTYRLLAARNTKTAMIAALGRSRTVARDGNLYLTDVPPKLFATVVKATNDDTPVDLRHLASARALTRAAEASVREKQP